MTVVTVDTKTGFVETENDRIIMAILLIALPPLAVLFKSRGCSGWVCLSILLYILFVFPAYGMAVWFCFIRDRKNEVRTDLSPPQPPQAITSP